MDFSSGSVPPNQPSNSKPMPPCPRPQDSQEDKERKALEQFWHQQFSDIQSNEAEPQHLLPARIKKIMKSKKNIKMISSDAPQMLAKACEVFVQELTFRAWIHAESNKKRSLKHCDVAMAIKKDEAFNFLANVADCGHDHHDVPKGVKAGSKGSQASQSQAAGFVQNPMMNMEEMMERNLQQLVQPPPLPPYNLPSDLSEMMQMNPYLPGQFQTMQAPYLPSDESQMMQHQYLPLDQSQMMQLQYLPCDDDQAQSQMVQPPYPPSDQSQVMLPPYPSSTNRFETMQPSYLPNSDQSQIMQQPYLPNTNPFPYNYHPK